MAHAAQQIQNLEQQKQSALDKQNTFQPPANFQQNNNIPLTFTQPPPPQYSSSNQSSFIPEEPGNSNSNLSSCTSPTPHQSQVSDTSTTSQQQNIPSTSDNNSNPLPGSRDPPSSLNSDNNFSPIMNQNLNIPGANPINPNIPPLTSLQIPPPNLLLNPEVLAEGGLPPFTQPPPPFFEPGAPAIFPDFSKPPPGFPVPAFAPPVVEEIVPTIPYYDLPAGLMVPLVKVRPNHKN